MEAGWSLEIKQTQSQVNFPGSFKRRVLYWGVSCILQEQNSNKIYA